MADEETGRRQRAAGSRAGGRGETGNRRNGAPSAEGSQDSRHMAPGRWQGGRGAGSREPRGELRKRRAKRGARREDKGTGRQGDGVQEAARSPCEAWEAIYRPS